MGYQTPNIDRVASEGMMFTDLLRRAELHGRPGLVHHRPGRPAHRPDQGRPAGRSARPAQGRSDDRRAAQGAGLRDRPVRQEPPGRPQRVPAHGPRLRRVLRQPLSPERRGRAGTAGLSRRTRPSVAKFGPRGVLDCKASDKDDPTVDPRFGKVGKQVCKDTGPLTKKRMETIDDDIADRAIDFIQRQNKAGKPALRLGELHPHAPAHPHQAGKPRPGRPVAEPVSRHHDRPRQERRPGPQGARRSRHRRQHLRHVLDRQRPAHELVARRRHDAVPQREEHQLGRRLPRAGHGALAGQDQAGPGFQRDRRPPRLAADACSPSAAMPT